jgi:SAM-dependent methyltransferase
MRLSVKELIPIIIDTLPLKEPIYEFGSYQTPGQEGYADLRSLFSGKKFVGTDMRMGPGVDKVIDLHKIDLPNNSVGTALILDTLEHVENPHQAMSEVYRVLKPGGMVVISSVMKFPIHDYPADYWRFTPEAFKTLLKKFSTRTVFFTGEEIFPLGVHGIGFKNNNVSFAKLNQRLKPWAKKWYHEKPKWFALAEMLTPPILIELYRKLKYRDGYAL